MRGAGSELPFVSSTADGKHLWAETYEKDMRDILALQSEVAGEIQVRFA